MGRVVGETVGAETSVLDAVLPSDDGEAITQLGASLAAIQAALLERISRYDRQQRWKTVGATSMQAWLVAHLDVTYPTATSWMHTAHALDDLPGISAALGEGRLSLDQVRALCRFATADTEHDLLRWAPDKAASELQTIARDHEADTVTVAGDNRAHRDRQVSWWWGEHDRRLRLNAVLPPDQGVVVVKALQRIAYQALPDETGTYEHFDARCADALYRIASQSIGADTDPDRATIVVHIDADTLTTGDGVALVEHGPLIPTETARRFACDSRFQLFATFESQVVGIGRLTRRVPPAMMRALRHRDRSCRFPGCDRTRWLHAHHLIHWANGGPTSLDNLILLCGDHHRFVHEDGWTISGDPHNPVQFITRHGTPYTPNYHPVDRQQILKLVATTTGAITKCCG